MNIRTRVSIAIADLLERRKLKKMYEKMNSVGRNVHFCRGYQITGYEKIEIGDNVWFGNSCLLQGEGGLTIGSGTLIGRYTDIYTQFHNYDSDDLKAIPYDERYLKKPVVIGENVIIGAKACVLSGVTIGEGAVIGASSVIRKDVPPFAVVGGNPAIILKYRNIDKYQQLKAAGKIYLDMVYDYDISTLKKTQYRNNR